MVVADVNCTGNINIIDALLVAQYYVGLITEFPCGSTPVPTDPPGTGEMRIYPELTSVSCGESFLTGIQGNSGLHGYFHFEFGVYFDSSILTIDTSYGIDGISPVIDTIISSVEISNGFIRIIGDRISDEPYPYRYFYIFWIASPDRGGSTMIDLAVFELTDEDNRTIGNPEGIPGYVEVAYTAPTSVPTASPTPEITPDPTPTPTRTPSPSLIVDILLPESSSWGGTNHWIPNTGEILGPFRIKITVENFEAGTQLTGDAAELELLPPLDDNFNAGETGTINIMKNRGTCEYAVYALYDDDREPEIIMTFTLDSDILNSDDRYETVSSAPGISLVIGDDGYVNHQNTGNTGGRDFGIGVLENTGNIRPGDDLRLKVGLLHYPEFSAAASTGDFVAVYDHKMIWRTHLYIDDGADDWNNNNRWTYARGNKWDRDWLDHDDDRIIKEAGPFNGGQCEIPAWTRWNDGVLVTGTVAYSWGCADSMKHFHEDLEEQKNALSAYYSDGTGGNPYPENNEQQGENPPPSDHRNWSPWENTYAPGTGNNRWHNYLFGRFDEEDETYHYLTINGIRYNPYMPGLSTWKKFDQDNYHDYDTKRSAGVDCVGFVQRSASYEDNPYRAIDLGGRCIWGGGMPSLMDNRFGSDEYSWAITDRNLLIPGDVLIGNGHIVMVLSIQYTGNARTINFNLNGTSDDVVVIESTRGPNNEWCVLNTQRWSNLGAGYAARRLRVN